MIYTKTNEPIWEQGSKRASLSDQEVHVWRTWLDLEEGLEDWFWRQLSRDEQERADRYFMKRDRRRFVAARGWLRAVLAGYVQCEPRQIQFTYEAWGKPALAGVDPRFQFNLAHSEEMAVCVVTRDRRVGIDVEKIRKMDDLEQIARRYFSKKEQADLLRLGEADRHLGFFNCWTRKEAYLKATGEGVTAGLDQFQVTLIPGDRPALVNRDGMPEESARWEFHDLKPAPGYASALTIEGVGLALTCWDWTRG